MGAGRFCEQAGGQLALACSRRPDFMETVWVG